MEAIILIKQDRVGTCERTPADGAEPSFLSRLFYFEAALINDRPQKCAMVLGLGKIGCFLFRTLWRAW